MIFKRIKTNISNRLKDIREENQMINQRNKEIRAKALKSALDEKEIQEINLAKQRQIIKADRRLKQMKSGGSGFFQGFNSSYGNAFGQPKQIGTQKIIRYKGKGKKRRKIITNRPVNSSYSFGGLIQGNNRVDVLGIR
jgi:hypothetical protein